MQPFNKNYKKIIVNVVEKNGRFDQNISNQIEKTREITTESNFPVVFQATDADTKTNILHNELQDFTSKNDDVFDEYVPKYYTKNYYLKRYMNYSKTNSIYGILIDINEISDPHRELNIDLHFINARPHTTRKVNQFLAENNMKKTFHPPYSPDIAHCDFFLFGYIKSKLNCFHFESVESLDI